METDAPILVKPTAGVLVVDDERSLRFTLSESLSEEGYRVDTASDGAEALSKVEGGDFQLVLLDQKLPDANGIEVLRKIKAKRPELPVVIMTAYGKFENAVEAARAGCYDYIGKPFELDHIKLVLANALALARAHDEVARLKAAERRRAGSTIVSAGSPAMEKIFSTMKKIGQSGTSTILLEGETGVGKELVAREIHDLSARRDGPFIPVNCSAIPESLLEGELFGSEKGAYTDSKGRKRGVMEQANGGTLFLDEIGEMQANLQARLLRALEQRRFRRLGGETDVSVDIRVVAATNRDLKAMVDQGKFREDLYFRLAVIRVPVPPLRERTGDLQSLIDHFVEHFNQEFGKRVKGPNEEALALMLAYRWPGNVRELKNVIERAVLLESEDWILPEHLPLEIVGAGGSAPKVLETRLHVDAGVLTLAKAEQIAIEMALTQAGGNKTRAAEALGISRQTLRTKLKEYRMEAPGGHDG
ncbi:MAG TPA: sigma-54 dependent transcriptional regulator [Candidatus Omnitrophota bacterium]|jgi:DNA-binding NtrC family response regulator|nr:sigma-54 dependent transcriptional regulator [Candidatus Omnitrophota bacterium]